MTHPPRLPFALRAVACILFMGHMAATCTPHIPAQSALQPLSRPFQHYVELTGIWQSWDMFTTIPYLHDYDVALDVTEADGASRRMGVVLPGLLAYDRTVRNETFFIRVIGDAGFTAYFDGYATRVCSALRAMTGRGGQSLVFHESYERLNWLQDIRNTGAIAIHEDHPSKTFSCTD